MNNLTLLVIALGVALTRFAPFILMKDEQVLKKHEDLLRLIPYATISLLLVYGFKDFNVSNFWAMVFGTIVCVTTYLFKRNAIVSILLSTIVYMLIYQNI